jgi:hypothetical protein
MRTHAASLAAALILAASAAAQSPLTTLFNYTTTGGAGWTMYFDLQVNIAVTISRLDVNTGVPIPGSIDVYYKTGTYVGFDTTAAAWTLGSNGPCTGAVVNTPTACALTTPFTLAPGSYGIAVVHNAIAPYYTNGNGTSTPGSGTNQTYGNAELILRAGASAGGGLGTAICCTPRVFNGSIYYSVSGAGNASKTPYGSGCYDLARSFYEDFATAAAMDLGNSSLSMIYNGSSGYSVQPGVTAFVAPSGSAITIANGDDAEQTVTLASPFPYPGGPASALTVCSNGFVSAASGNGTNYTPSAATFLGFPQACWATWHDFNPLTGGAIKFEEVGNVTYLTWLAVADWSGGGFSTFQYQFDRATGNVHVVWQAMSTLGGTGYLVGFKLAGAVVDPGSRDISATLAATFPAGLDVRALALDASARPITGTAINLVTTNVPAGSAVGVNIMSFTRYVSGLDLGGIGMPGCRQFVGLDATVVFLPSGGSGSRPLPIPNNPALSGLRVSSQSAVFATGVNPLGVLASNGLDLLIGIQ